MADNVIRKDIVQIGFEIDGNPFAEITNILNDLKSTVVSAIAGINNDFKELGKSASIAGDGIGEIANSTRDLKGSNITAVADDMKAISSQAQSAVPKVAAVAKEVKDIAKQDFSGAFDSLNDIPIQPITKAVSAIEKLKNGFLKIKNLSLSDVGNGISKGLNKGLSSAQNGAGKLLNALKKVATVSFNKLVSGLKGVANGLANAGKAAANGLGKATTFTTKVLGGAVAGLGAASVGAATGMFKLTDMASDLSETTNKVNTVFGETTGGAVLGWANDSIKNMGLARQTALDMTALFGDMGTSMGIPQGEAANMSMSLTQLGADLASFKNIGIEQATTALNGIFTGETESLKSLGVVMTQTSLDAFALETGIGKTTKEMTEAEKVNLRYAYVMSKAANAQGDFAKTGGGFANQLRMVKEQVKEMGTNIGNIFLPSMEKGIRVVNGFATELNTVFADGWQDGDMTQISSIITRALNSGAAAIQTGLPKIVGFLVPALNSLAAIIIKEMPAILKTLLNGVTALFTGIIDTIKQNKSLIVAGVTSLGRSLVESLLTLVPELLLLGGELLLSLMQGLVKEAPSLINAGMQAIMSLLDGLLAMLPELLDAAFVLIMALSEGLIANLPKIIDAAIGIILTIVNFIVENLPAIITVAIQIIIALATGLIQAIPELLAAIPKIVMALIDGLRSVNWGKVGWDIISGIGKGIWDGVTGIFGGGKKAGEEVTKGITEGINANSYMPQQAAISTTALVTTGLKPKATALNSYGSNTMQSYGAGLATGAPSVTTTAKSTANAVKGTLTVNASGAGQVTANSYAAGLNSARGGAIKTATKLAGNVESAATTTIPVAVNPNAASFDELTNVSKKTSNDCLVSFEKSFTAIKNLTTKSMSEVVSIIAKTNLYETGRNIMLGLNNGMLSMKETLIATAREIAKSIPTTTNTTLDVQSPSRVMFKTGAFTAEGQELGMLSKLTDIKSAATKVGESSVPIKQPPSRYTPESLAASSPISNSETNNYSPQFTANFQGGSNDRDMQRQIKQWMFQYMDEYFASMGRRNPKIAEV